MKVAFEDYIGNAEEFESAAFPGFGRIMWSAESACAMPSLAGRELVWTGQVGVGAGTEGGIDLSHGFGPLNTGSTLSDKTFLVGVTDYTIDTLIVGAPGAGGGAGTMQFSVTADLPAASTSGLQLHVCDDTFHFGDGPDSGTSPDASYIATHYTYSWFSSGLDWSGHATRRVYLSKGDTRKPVLTDVIVDVDTLTMIYDEELKRTDPVPRCGADQHVCRPGRRRQRVRALRHPRRGGAERQPGHHDSRSGRRGRADDWGCLFRERRHRRQQGPGPGGQRRRRIPSITGAGADITLAGPGAKSAAFAGAAQIYAIGDVIGVDVMFNESVTVTATSTAKPRIALEIGSETVWAVWKTGQGAGTVHRFDTPSPRAIWTPMAWR